MEAAQKGMSWNEVEIFWHEKSLLRCSFGEAGRRIREGTDIQFINTAIFSEL